MRAVAATVHGGKLASELSWLTIAADSSVQLTALKKADNGEGLLLRLVNLNDKEESVRIGGELLRQAREVNETMMNEQKTGSIRMQEEEIRTDIPKKRIVTFVVEK